MSQPYDPEHSDRERILHKLLGAASLATYEEDYEIAVEMARLAVAFWDERYAAVETDATAPAIADGGDPDAG